jgi:predicted secreted protein
MINYKNGLFMMLFNFGDTIRDHSDCLWNAFKPGKNKVANYGNTKIVLTRVIIIFALILGFESITLAGEIMRLSENDSGKTVEIHVGDELEVVLPANPTTGYVWEVGSLDSTVLKLVSSDFLASDKAIGSGGMEIIKFHAIAAGTSSVRLIYHRSFELNMPPLKTFEMTVIIKN